MITVEFSSRGYLHVSQQTVHKVDEGFILLSTVEEHWTFELFPKDVHVTKQVTDVVGSTMCCLQFVS